MNSHLNQKSSTNGAVNKNQLVPDEIGSCISCGSKSVCRCQRCGDFYCSPQCQRRDWPNHRYICFAMPSLVKASNWSMKEENGIVDDKIPFLQAQMPNKNVQEEEKQIVLKETHPEGTKIPTNDSCVILTGFKSTNRCYIRSTNPSDEENYKKILKEIDDFGKTARVLSGKPKAYSYALTLREGKWCRVQIMSNKSNNVARIQFVDYGGNIFGQNLNSLREISNHLISLPCYVHMVQLKDISVISSEHRLMEALSKYTNQEYKLVLEKQDDRMGGNAKLFNWKTKALLNIEIDRILKNVETDNASYVSSLSNKTENKKSLEKMTPNQNLNQKTETTKSLENKTLNQNLNQRNEKTNNANNPKAAKVESENRKSLEKKTPNQNLYQRNEDINSANSPKANKVECENENNSPNSSTITKRKTIQQPHQIQFLKPCLEPPFEICPLNEKDINCKVIITDDSYVEIGYIGCLLEKYCENLKEVSTYLKQNRVSDKPYKAKLNEYCLAEFENEWYRAKVVEVLSGDKYRVVYIDFTNEMELTSSLIRRYPMSLTVPCCTTLCAIDGLPEDMSDKLKDFLKSECVAFKELHIDNVRIEEDLTYVSSKELLKKMQLNKLL